MIKKTLIIVASFISFFASSDEYLIRIAHDDINSAGDWVLLSSTMPNGWIDDGTAYNCTLYTPETSTHKVGKPFVQSKSCLQSQIGELIEIYQHSFSKDEIEINKKVNQEIPVTETSQAYGENNELSGFLNGTFDTFGTHCDKISSASQHFSILPGTTLSKGTHITTCSGFLFAYQTDGNFVIYKDGIALWHTHTYSVGATHMAIQNYGNIVIYANQTPLWDFGTSGYPNAKVLFQNDGNLTLFDSEGHLIKPAM